MGTIIGKESGIGEALFSKTRRLLLGLLYGNPDRTFYAKEIVRFAGVGIGTVQRELANLTGARLVTVSRIGNQKHYQANRESPVFEELRGIALKTFGLSDVLREALHPIADEIDLAFIYGSVTQGQDHAGSDIDLMVVSDAVNYADIMKILTFAEEKLGRTINPSIYKPGEFSRESRKNSGFIHKVLNRPRWILIGDENDLPES